MRTPIFAANWKLNHGPSDARAFLQRFLSLVPRQTDRSMLFFPPALSLPAVVETVRDRADILVGVQHVHTESLGAFTGENSVLIARDAGARAVLVGHSERRHLFGETDESTAKKMALALQARMVAMLCVGETLDERQAGATEHVVLRQLTAGLAEVEDAQLSNVLIAYEPVWAIGTGQTATPDDASAIHTVIRGALDERLGASKGGQVPICYGGSVNRGNVAELLAADNVDGVLVGGASLDPDNWSSIVKTGAGR